MRKKIGRCRITTLRQNKSFCYNNKAFTLIELLVVVLIIGILAAVAVSQYTLAVEKARAAKILPLMTAIYNAQKTYHLANNVYATRLDELDIDFPSGGTLDDAGNRLTYPDGSSFYWCQECTRPSLQGYPNGKYVYYVEFYTDWETRYCWAGKNDSIANKICKAISGSDKRDDAGTSVHWKYKL